MTSSSLKPASAGAAQPDDQRVAQSSRVDERPRISSDALLKGGKEITIEHGGEEYRLRVTSKGRLILTK